MKGGGNLSLVGLAKKIKEGMSDEEVINKHRRSEYKPALKKLFNDMETNSSMLDETQGKNKWATGVKVDNGKGNELNWTVKTEEYSKVYTARKIRDKGPGGANLTPKTPPPPNSPPPSGKGADKLRVETPPLTHRESASSNVNVGSLLDAMKKFH